MLKRDIELPIIFLSAFGQLPTAVQAMKQGSFDFLQKPVDEGQLIEAISKAIDTYYKEKSIGMTLEKAAREIKKLTDKERAVAELLSKGLLKRTIAERLGVSKSIIEAQTNLIYRKLDVHSVSELSLLMKTTQNYLNP